MNNEENKKKEEIESALAAIAVGDFLETSEELLAVLGYQIELIGKRWETGDEFIEESPARNQNTKTEQEFHNKAESVELAFYLTSDEIARSQPNRLESSAFDEGLIKSFIFCTGGVER